MADRILETEISLSTQKQKQKIFRQPTHLPNFSRRFVEWEVVPETTFQIQTWFFTAESVVNEKLDIQPKIKIMPIITFTRQIHAGHSYDAPFHISKNFQKNEKGNMTFVRFIPSPISMTPLLAFKFGGICRFRPLNSTFKFNLEHCPFLDPIQCVD